VLVIDRELRRANISVETPKNIRRPGATNRSLVKAKMQLQCNLSFGIIVLYLANLLQRKFLLQNQHFVTVDVAKSNEHVGTYDGESCPNGS
jgi:hypothetical protein